MAKDINKVDIPVRLVAPDYLYHYPCFRKVKLPAVKQQIFHPNLPTLRHMERDDMTCKLPDEHCRTSTVCGPRDFALGSMNVLVQPTKQLSCLGCTELGWYLHKRFMSPLDIQRAGLVWHKYLHNPMARAAIMTREKPFVEPRSEAAQDCDPYSSKNIRFDGVPLRYIKANQKDWRFTFKCEPRLLGGGQQPVPSDVDFPRELRPHAKSISRHM